MSRITILPHGQRLGVTQFAAQEDHYNYSRASLMARIAVGLGGRIAEELTFGPESVTTGAEDDLQSVTALAWRMVTHWGMSRQMGVVFADYRQAVHPVAHMSASTARYVSGPDMATLIDSEIQHILADGRVTACALLTEHNRQLTKLAEMLMRCEQLDRSQFEAALLTLAAPLALLGLDFLLCIMRAPRPEQTQAQHTFAVSFLFQTAHASF